MAEIEAYIGGFAHDRCIKDGEEIAQIWRGGEKKFQASLPPPTDYILAIDFNGNITDQSIYNHPTSGSGFTYETAPDGRLAIKFNQGIRNDDTLTLGKAVTIFTKLKLFQAGSLFGLGKTPESNTANTFFINAMSISTLRVGLRQGGTLNLKDASGIPNDWVKLCVVLDRSQTTHLNQIKVYLNGTQLTLTSAGAGLMTLDFTPESVYIGATNLVSSVSRSLMQDFRMYDRALTVDEIQALNNI